MRLVLCNKANLMDYHCVAVLPPKMAVSAPAVTPNQTVSVSHGIDICFKGGSSTITYGCHHNLFKASPVLFCYRDCLDPLAAFRPDALPAVVLALTESCFVNLQSFSTTVLVDFHYPEVAVSRKKLFDVVHNLSHTLDVYVSHLLDGNLGHAKGVK